MRIYKSFQSKPITEGEYSLVPIRDKDRYEIMNWRNEQIYHLRQAEPLTKEIQDAYFRNVIAELFEQRKPNQILFSFLKGEKCIGYGGLVHINWFDKNSEISFLVDTELEKNHFGKYWLIFLRLIEQVAFDKLHFHKLFTYAVDLRPKLYPILEEAGFQKEAVLRDHILFNGTYVDVVLHHKFNPNES